MGPSNRASAEGPEGIAEPMYWVPSRRFLRRAILAICVGAIGFLAVVLLYAPEQHARMVGPGILLLVGVAAWMFEASGRVRTSVLVLVVGSWIVATTICVFNGGVRTPVVIALPLLVVMAGWLLGTRSAMVMAALSMTATLGFVIAESRGVLPAQPPTPPAMYWVVQATVMVISAILIRFFIGSYRQRIEEVRGLSGNLARLEAEAAMAETIRRNSHLLDSTGRMAKVGGWELDLASRKLTWTTEVFRIHEIQPGVAPAVDEATGYYAAEARPMIESALRDATERGIAYDLELPLVTAGGRRIWVRTIGEPQFVDGKVRRLSGTIQDISDQKQAAQALKISVDNLHRTLESIGEGIFAYDGRDPSGHLLFANDEFFRIWKIPLEEAPNTGRAEIISAARKLFIDPDAEVARIGEILASSTPHEDRVPLNDGRMLLRRSAPIMGNGGVSRVWTFRDITNEEQALVALQEREEQLRRAQEIAHLGSFDWDPVSGALRWSEEHFRLWGLEPGVATPEYALFRAGVHPDDVAQLEAALQTAIGGGRWYDCKHRVVWPDGGVRHIHGRGEVMFDGSGQAVRMLGTVQDITERVAAEEALIAARDEADDAKKEADAANAAKSEFLSNMSHEIRTPLNAVLGLAQVGQRETEGAPVRRLFDQMLDSGKHLLGIINNILDFSKIEAGKLSVETEAVSLRRLTERVLGFCAARAEEKGLILRFERGADLPEAFQADFLRLSQVLGNLLDNAIKFTSRGEVVLAVDRIGDTLRFRVRDTGIGMSAEQVARVFLPFEQADGSTTRRYGGTGLGLVICKRLVELMGGTLQVESAAGSGSQFEFVLRLVAAAAPAAVDAGDVLPAVADVTRLTRSLDGMRILVAEDNPVNQAVLKELLGQEGAQLICADDGLQALERIAAMPADGPDIVLTDIQMPNMDGHQLARRLRELHPSLPVIGLTAHAFAEERQRCFDSGMKEHMTKPIELNSLVRVLRRHARWWAPPVADDIVPPATEASARGAPALATGGGLVDWDAMLGKYQGRQAFVDKLVGIALASQATAPVRLRDAAGRLDFDALAFTAHSIKGMSANFSAARLHSLAVETEAAARERRDDAGAMALRLADLMDEFLAALAARMGKATGAVPSAS
ncbi:ATP-binding protein [Sulfuritalea sp.]|uniref:ATP-binding protein n=1 Tax=Sulfuritalea sp. TaxID=2480090 RepID=UPI001ACA943F|nr:ATP-binding protein [Sulfuritalea sp.]MBN8476088.1 response regulator [Sulfuritalea sp.]